MKTPPCKFLALAAVMALCSVGVSFADSTTPPSEQGSTSGTTPPKTSSSTAVGSSDTMSTTNSTPKLDNKVPAGNNGSPSH
jgi:hypothetical protein